MKMPNKIENIMLAVCGVNCMVCYKHLAKKNACSGCNFQDETLPNSCRNCKIYECAKSKNVDYCFRCSVFPCKLIKNLDKSYRQRYNVSLIENGLNIKENGIDSFMVKENEKWTCEICGGIVSQHDGICSECGTERK